MSEVSGKVARHVVCPIADLPPGTRRIVSAGRTEVGVFNVDGRYHALSNVCPHAGAPICVGPVTGMPQAARPYEREWIRDGEIIRCPWHGWEFDLLTGHTIAGPPMRVRTWDVVVEDDMIMIQSRREAR